MPGKKRNHQLRMENPEESSDSDISVSDVSVESEFSDMDSIGEEKGVTVEQIQQGMAPVIEAAKGKIQKKKNDKKKKNKKKKSDSKKGEDDEEMKSRGVIYLGHVPYGFFEDQMKGFFSQFGTVTRVKLARSKKTGNSKHYGFVEFASREVAEIVAVSMNGYMMFGKTLVCQLIPPNKVHPDTFKGTNKKFRKVPWGRIARDRHNRARTPQEQAHRIKKLLKKEAMKREKLAALGIEYDFPGYAAEISQSGIELDDNKNGNNNDNDSDDSNSDDSNSDRNSENENENQPAPKKSQSKKRKANQSVKTTKKKKSVKKRKKNQA